MKNKLMFISLVAIVAAGSSIHAGLSNAVWRNGVVHINRSKSLVPTSHLSFGVQAAQVRVQAAHAKIAQAAAGSINSGVITEVFPRAVRRTGESAVRFYGNKYGWKTAFAKAFAPAAILTGSAVAKCASASSTNDSSTVVVQEVQQAAQKLAPVVEVSKNDVVGKIITTNVMSLAPEQALSFTDKVRALALSTGTKLQTFGSSAYQTTIGGGTLGYFKCDRQVATTAAVAATVGLTYATYKAYKKGSFSKLNPFRKAVEEAK